MMNGPRPLLCVSTALALATLIVGCSSGGRDGATTKAACVAYAESANTCWQVASGENILDVAVCEAIDADIDTASIPEDSSCGLKDLADIYTCYAEAFSDEITTSQPTCSDVGCSNAEGCSTPSTCASAAVCTDPSFETEEACEAEEHDWDTLLTSEACQQAGLEWTDTSDQQGCEAAGHTWGALLAEEACEAAGERWGALTDRASCEAVGHTWASNCGPLTELDACETCCTGDGWEGSRLNDDPDAEPCQCQDYGLCGSTATAGTVDVSECDYVCDRCAAGSLRCDGQKVQDCDPGTGNYKTRLTCPDHTTCNKGECIANEPETPTCTSTCADPDDCPDDTCDGVDDNCDGSTDEGFTVQGTTCGVGPCEATGVTLCLGGAVTDTCIAGEPAADDATCDGVDDDCDGIADEDFTPADTACGVGACEAAGVTSCADGVEANSCSPGEPGLDDATCDGVDDDCDGIADEDFVSETSTCGQGVCEANGVTSCVDGIESDSCVILPDASPDDATCDGADDDCDGSIDEDYATSATTCGVGTCEAAGELSCVEGQEADSCSATEPSCDGKACDDDDGCGTLCGCPDGETCNAGTCE
ncbi:MAG: MopE-related protein [Myxococcota bacterium]|jgi:hypothetical protein|nr:MopE-related protein [Myxococcota bacterium]